MINNEHVESSLIILNPREGTHTYKHLICKITLIHVLLLLLILITKIRKQNRGITFYLRFYFH